MNSLLSVLSLSIVLFLSSAFTGADSSFRGWKKLGSKQVYYALDRDVIHVGAREGGFSKLKVVVTGGNLNMHKMVVEYANGSKDNVPLKFSFSKGSDSRVIDLQGGKRVIKDIIFWYDTKNSSRQKAIVHVYGHK